jgi:hypothetical protein
MASLTIEPGEHPPITNITQEIRWALLHVSPVRSSSNQLEEDRERVPHEEIEEIFVPVLRAFAHDVADPRAHC